MCRSRQIDKQEQGHQYGSLIRICHHGGVLYSYIANSFGAPRSFCDNSNIVPEQEQSLGLGGVSSLVVGFGLIWFDLMDVCSSSGKDERIKCRLRDAIYVWCVAS
jgi:hypothetical protein